MPKFTLDEINYIVTDSRQKILNVDFTDEINQKKRNVSFFTDNEDGSYTNVLSIDFGIVNKNNYNEHGFVFLNEPNAVIRALYDAKDVALKSAVAERITNRNEVNNNGGETNDNIEMYIPHFRENPLGFVQNKKYSYGMSEKTVIGPVIRSTTLYEQKHKQSLSSTLKADSFGNPTWKYFLNPYDKYNSDVSDPSTVKNVLPTYLYTPLEALSNVIFNKLSIENNHLLSSALTSADTLTIIKNEAAAHANSYYSFIEYYGELSSSILSNLFKPVHNFENIDHNYIIEVPLKDDKTTTVNNQYALGIVNADMIMGKNIFDDIYDTNISSVSDFTRIRSYKGISTVGRKVFLTYFDDLSYSANNSEIDRNLTFEDVDSSGPQDVSETSSFSNEYLKRDYMKIECLDAINRFVSTSMHKANLYSVKVYGLDNNLLADKKFDSPNNEYRNNIKNDIKNSIRRIVTNFVPAHTQYFDVVDFQNSKPVEEFC